MLVVIKDQDPAPPAPAVQPTAGKVCASDFADRSDMVATMLLSPEGAAQLVETAQAGGHAGGSSRGSS